jgi:RNA 2',3'-cyclic 3'-phosphodiesterase
MRLFVGIDLDPVLAASLEEDAAVLRSTLHRACPRLPARWVSRANLHLTLVFIGHVADADASVLTSRLAPPFEVRPFELRIEGFGAFPASGPLRVIWMGVVAGMPELSLLHSEITARLAREGHAVEAKPYTPHLTIARVKDARGPSARAARDIARKARGRGGSARVGEVTLFQSHQSAAGSVYDRLLRIPLLK